MNAKLEIIEVLPGGAADRAGLRRGDVVIGLADRSFRGGTFKSVDEANKVLDALIFDYWHQTTTITIQRQGQELTLPIAPMVYKWNIPLTPLPKELRHF